MSNQEYRDMMDELYSYIEDPCPIFNEKGKQVGEYILHNKSVHTIKINKEHRKQGHATRTMTDLYNKGIITGPSDSVLSTHIVAIWKKLGIDVEVTDDLTKILDDSM